MKFVQSFVLLSSWIGVVALGGQVPASLDDVLNKARAALQARDGKAAYELLAPLSQSEPTNAAVWRLLGLSLHYQNELDKALEATGKSLELEPDSAPSMVNMARTLAKKGNQDQAFKWLEKVNETGKCNMGLRPRRSLLLL